MPEPLRHALDFITIYRAAFIAGGAIFVLLTIAIITLTAALRRSRNLRRGPASSQPTAIAVGGTLATTEVIDSSRIKRTKLAIGDVANPWTQGVYERHSPEDKIDQLLPTFAFDAQGTIHRTQLAKSVATVNADELSKLCNTAVGLAVHGTYATLVLWHSGSPGYGAMALKVASHTLMAPEQKELIRFLFQDVTGVAMRPSQVPGLTRWKNSQFRAAIQLYVSPNITPAKSAQLKKILPASLKELHALELAKKLPVRMIYREAVESNAFSEGLYALNLRSLQRFMSVRRWLRLRNSDKNGKFKTWIAALPCASETQALLQIANPDIFEKEDLLAELAQKIESILMHTNAKDWLFNQKKQPPLTHRLHYFKFFCLFGKFNEAVRCYATLGIFRKERATRLYYARALFLSGMPHDAWAEMSSLLVDYPRDVAVLNEAGIYAHKLARYDEASEIFSRARGMYPDDATLAYNEAVFIEQFSQVQVKEKWSAVQKMSEPPVVG